MESLDLITTYWHDHKIQLHTMQAAQHKSKLLVASSSFVPSKLGSAEKKTERSNLLEQCKSA